MKPRTRARSVALQALYEIDLTDHPVGIVLEGRIKAAKLDDALGEFARSIVLGVKPVRKELDQFIAEHAPEWPIDQVSSIDRNLLRIALWEFAMDGQTPIKVAINEAVELAKRYGSDSTPRFVNGVLGSLAKRQNEINESISKIILASEEPKE
ncbi:MAG: transcription antitermination factor NusB [Anaerolineae bacterium]|nr:transcription antitermination factor NusB [Anaerolineae bacterium]